MALALNKPKGLHANKQRNQTKPYKKKVFLFVYVCGGGSSQQWDKWQWHSLDSETKSTLWTKAEKMSDLLEEKESKEDKKGLTSLTWSTYSWSPKTRPRSNRRLLFIVFKHIISQNIVIYWPSTEPSIKRCTFVNKWKNSGSRWKLDNNITRCPERFESVGDKMPKWEPAADKGLWALSDPRLSNPAKMRKKCCYGRRRTWGRYSSLSRSPAHLSYTTTITLSRMKRERLYFYKEVFSFVHWNSSLLLTMFPHIFVYS